jgi:hypothetical protein
MYGSGSPNTPDDFSTRSPGSFECAVHVQNEYEGAKPTTPDPPSAEKCLEAGSKVILHVLAEASFTAKVWKDPV